MRIIIVAAASAGLVALAGCEKTDPAIETQASETSSETTLSTEGDFATNFQTALIEAEPGSIIRLPAGTFQLETGLSLDVDGVSLVGAGQSMTILDFSGQTTAGEGILVTSDDVTLMDFTLRDPNGDGIKSKGADRITYRHLTVEWPGEPDESNGAYGIYPVESEDVLIENVTVRGASDAGIYVGQSDNIIVRNSVVEYNVAGIEIENSTHADVYGNIARNNTGGILVFDLPDLPKTGGNSTRVYNNRVADNNTRNFAPAGNIVAGVPSGTGMIIMANHNVHVFGNDFTGNRTTHILLTAYTEPFSDKTYNPLPRDIVIRDNRYAGGGEDPQGLLAAFAPVIGGKLPAIVTDGVTSWEGGSGDPINLVIDEPETVGFLDLGIGRYPLDPAQVAPTTVRPDSMPVDEPAEVSLPQDKG